MSENDFVPSEPVRPAFSPAPNEGPVQSNNMLLFGLIGCGCCVAFFFIIGILIALMLPAVQAAREAARRMQCTNTEKQLALAFHVYHDAYQTFPPAYTTDESGNPLHSWRVLILPYIEQSVLYEAIRLDEPCDSEYNRQFHNVSIWAFKCPSNPNTSFDANCCYSVVLGEHTVFPGAEPVKIGQITDGTSTTLLIVERKNPVCWMDPTSELTLDEILTQGGPNKGSGGLGSNHTGGVNMALCDGSVMFVSNTVDLETLKNLCLRDSGQAVMVP